MEKNKTSAYLSYLDDLNQTISGYFEIIEVTQTYVKIKTSENIVTIPMHRILKIKQKIGEQ